MKVLVIPDVHLKAYMFARAKELLKKGVADMAVCLMDLPDDWGMQYQIEAYANVYKQAIAFAEEFPETRWCYGNHDLSYLWEEMESGYSPMARATVCWQLAQLSNILPENNPIQYVQRIDNILFCHGGICRYFVEQYVPEEKYEDVDFVVNTINSLDHWEMWNDASPIWYRPQDLKTPRMYHPGNLFQVVGHTPVRSIEKSGRVISCDVFSTYSNGEPIGSREFLVIDSVSGEYVGVE